MKTPPKIRYGKKIRIETVINDEVTDTRYVFEESIKIENKADLARELLVCAETVINEGIGVDVKLEPAKNETYLVRLVKTMEVR